MQGEPNGNGQSTLAIPPLAVRRAIVAAAIRADPTASDRKIALETGGTRESVAALRAVLVAAGNIPDAAIIRGRDGKEYRRCRRVARQAAYDRRVNLAAYRINAWAAVLADPEFASVYAGSSMAARRNLQAALIRLNAAENRRRREAPS